MLLTLIFSRSTVTTNKWTLTHHPFTLSKTEMEGCKTDAQLTPKSIHFEINVCGHFFGHKVVMAVVVAVSVVMAVVHAIILGVVSSVPRCGMNVSTSLRACLSCLPRSCMVFGHLCYVCASHFFYVLYSFTDIIHGCFYFGRHCGLKGH